MAPENGRLNEEHGLLTGRMYRFYGARLPHFDEPGYSDAEAYGRLAGEHGVFAASALPRQRLGAVPAPMLARRMVVHLAEGPRKIKLFGKA